MCFWKVFQTISWMNSISPNHQQKWSYQVYLNISVLIGGKHRGSAWYSTSGLIDSDSCNKSYVFDDFVSGFATLRKSVELLDFSNVSNFSSAYSPAFLIFAKKFLLTKLYNTIKIFHTRFEDRFNNSLISSEPTNSNIRRIC